MIVFNYFALLPWMWHFAIAATRNLPLKNRLEFNHVIEQFLLQTAFFLKTGIECFALLILAVGIIRAIIRLLAVRTKEINRPAILCSVRLDLGMSLTLSLEFLLAADIAATAVSPNWDAIARLAAISGIRTFLNFFLKKELKDLERQR